MSMRVDGCSANRMRRATCDATRLRTGCEPVGTTCIGVQLSVWVAVEMHNQSGAWHETYTGPIGRVAPTLHDTVTNLLHDPSCTTSSPIQMCGGLGSRWCGPWSSATASVPTADEAELVFANQFWAPLNRVATIATVSRDWVMTGGAVAPGATRELFCCEIPGGGVTHPIPRRCGGEAAPGTFVSPFLWWADKLAGTTANNQPRFRQWGTIDWYVIFDNLQTLPVTRTTLVSEMAAGRVNCYTELVGDVASVTGYERSRGSTSGGSGYFSVATSQSLLCPARFTPPFTYDFAAAPAFGNLHIDQSDSAACTPQVLAGYLCAGSCPNIRSDSPGTNVVLRVV